MDFSTDINLTLKSCKCKICGKSEGHNYNCFIEQLGRLENSCYKMNCPTCGVQKAVDLNRSDLFECRECHVQYQRVDEGSTDILIDEEKNDYIPIIICTDKGAGVFIYDKQINNLKRKIESHLHRKRGK